MILKDETIAEKFIKKGFWLYFFMLIVAPFGYLTRSIISHDLAPSDVGIIYSVIGFISFIGIYSDLGLSHSILYFLPKYIIEKKYDFVKTSIFFNFIVQIFSSIIIGFLLFYFAPYLAEHHFQSPKALEILNLFCIYFFISNIFSLFSIIFYSLQDTFNNSFIDFIRTSSVLGFSLFFFLNGKGDIYSYSIAFLFGISVGALFGIFLFLKGYHKTLFENGKINFDKNYLKSYISYSFFGLLASNIYYGISQTDQQMILNILGPEKAGIYANYLALVGIYAIFFNPILGLLFPVFTELITKKDNEKVATILSLFYKFFTVFSFLIGIIFAMLGKEISLFLFGYNFLESGILLGYNGPFIFIFTLVNINFSILLALGMLKKSTLFSFFGMILNIILNIFLIKEFGVLGGLISSILAYFLIFILGFYEIKKTYIFTIDYNFILKNFVFIGIVGFILFKIKNQFFDLSYEKIILFETIMLFSIIISALFLIFNFAYLKGFIQEIRKNFIKTR